MIFTSLSSSSSGNCTLISSGKENILVDCGISAGKIEKELKNIGLSLSSIDAVLLTHEHIDHVRGLKRLITGNGIPFYCSYGTYNGLSSSTKDGFFTYSGLEYFNRISADREFYIGSTLVRPFKTYHDTEGSLGYRFDTFDELFGHDLSLAVLTDCGHYDDYICSQLTGLDALLIEANHDPDMLMNGPYPMTLKRRISSAFGHSSNASCAELIKRVYTPKLKEVILAHLSDENNDPGLCLSYVKEAVGRPELSVSVAPKARMSKIVRL